MMSVTLRLQERPDGSVRGYISVLGEAVSEELSPLASMDGSTASSNGADRSGAMLDVLDILGSRLAYRLDQIILF